MYALARKNFLARNLTKLRKVFPEDYDFYPQTWVLPSEFADLKTYSLKQGKSTYIVKPDASSQGRGIFLTKNVDDLSPYDHFIVQRYIEKPFLIEDLKFDLRIYVLVAGCDPLRIFLHEEGLTRLATEEYTAPSGANLSDMCMHLTNYAVNKNNPNFVFNEDSEDDDVGHKRSLTSTMRVRCR
jgi:tubulin polyglutamylase TTLL6/13